MLINFVKQDIREAQQHQPQPVLVMSKQELYDDADLDIDALGNHACPTIFVKNFAPEITTEKLASLFPTNIKINLGNKQLRPGEFRTGYITFEDTVAAVAAKKAMTGFKDDVQQMPLVIYFSVRPQDQTKPNNYGGFPPNIALIQAGYPAPPPFHSSAPPSPIHSPSYSPTPFPLYSSHPSHSHTTHPSSFSSSLASYPSSPYSPSPYAAAMSSYSPLSPAVMYNASFSDPYGQGPQPQHGLRMHPHTQLQLQHVGLNNQSGDDARYSISDLFDGKGNAASNSLFVDCLPHNIRENQIHTIFSHSVGFKGLHMGTKALAPHEFRTAVVHFNTTENALKARAQLQNHRELGWTRPLIIHYAKR
eukprot:Phypoly_transcript_07126.p1 GENE.Phypoly_transcript_07126~~Phypoly_transcript_07126.p1  ORF type:complete len:362 (+),score=63.41 Phypoly_transcript_07126:374-1459(+)